MRDEKERKPACYRPNSWIYPLCLGAEHPVDFAENDCIHCCLYENMEDEGGYSYYDR
jgi:hypothetical protein